MKLVLQECALVARLHCMIRDMEKAEDASISYIPTSGLDFGERQQRLNESYNFICKCDACSMTTHRAKHIEKSTPLPDATDISAIRHMQFSYNQQILDLQRSNDGSSNDLDIEKMQDVESKLACLQFR